jgi:hypothetical protein
MTARQPRSGANMLRRAKRLRALRAGRQAQFLKNPGLIVQSEANSNSLGLGAMNQPRQRIVARTLESASCAVSCNKPLAPPGLRSLKLAEALPAVRFAVIRFTRPDEALRA